MANLIFDKAQIEATIDKIVDRTMRMDMTWDWPCGVAYYGICEAYEVTKNERYLQLVKDRVDEYIELGLPSWTVNTCSMGHCLITLYEHTGDEKYLDIAKSKVEYLEKEALRFGDHVLQHTVSVNNDFPEQAWADTLFMAGFFLLRMGVLLKDEALIDDALNQYYWHIKYLQDPESGLYYHGYNNITGDHMSGIKWGRANAWAAYTMSQVGVRLPQCYLYPKFLDVVGSLNDQLAALKLYQTENGLWRTIVDDAASYEEGKVQPGYDKQYVRDWLKGDWDFTGEPPRLPSEVIERTSARYRDAYEIITGSTFLPMASKKERLSEYQKRKQQA